MTSAMTIAELLTRGGSLTVPEAVAVVLSVIETSAGTPAADLREPYGPPSPDNIELRPDGAVVCIGCGTSPGVFELAVLLQQLLAGAPKIPGGLQYAVARALLEVEAPPFDSVDDFVRSIARFAPSDRQAALRALVDRADGRLVSINAPRLVVRQPAVPVPAPAAEPLDRRLHGARPDQLRRELRAAEELLYTRTVADSLGDPEPPRRRAATPAALAAVAVLLVGVTVAIVGPRHQLVPLPARTTTSRDAASPDVRPAVEASSSAAEDETAAHDARRPARQEAPAPRPNAAVANVSEQTPPEGNEPLVTSLDRDRRPVFSPSFAAQGSAVFFTGRTGAAADQLRVMTIVDDGARNYHVQPSPDGRQIAFDSDRDGDRGVYVADRDGSNVRRVSGPGYAAVPTWSPDGRQLVFERAETGNPRVWNLWLLQVRTGAMRRLTRYQDGQPWAASWFPDGRRIAYAHEDQLNVLDVQTGRTGSYPTPVPGRFVRMPAVSPDGERIAFQVARNGVWLLDLADGSTRCAVQDPTAGELSWAPDGRRLAFHSGRDGGEWGVYVMGPGGDATRPSDR